MNAIEEIKAALIMVSELISCDQCLNFKDPSDMIGMEPFYNLIKEVDKNSSSELVSVAIAALSSISECRYEQRKHHGCCMIYSSYFDMLSDYEKEELHRLKNSLPTFAEARQSARDFVLARCAARRLNI